MDAQGRGRADDIDPADQWVLNPNTGEYELRLAPSAAQSSVPGPRGSGGRGTTGKNGTTGRGGAARTGRTAPARRPGAAAPDDDAPSPRRRTGAPAEAAGRRGRRPVQKKAKGKKVLMWTGGTLAFVLIGASGAAYLYYEHLNNNITSVSDDGAGTGGFSKDRAINILLIGTDKRTGKGNEG
ncbi:LytR family transcriptional regulator, partial [Streptomyces sp. SID7499]|nr:LytR family transcriptional regulator [Streptomyces sp. SID7499]